MLRLGIKLITINHEGKMVKHVRVRNKRTGLVSLKSYKLGAKRNASPNTRVEREDKPKAVGITRKWLNWITGR